MADRRRRRVRPRSTRGRVWAIVGVVAFLAVDAVLVGFAVSSSREVASSTNYIEPSPHPQPSTTPTPTAEPVVALPVTRSLAAAGDTIWRAEAGSCSAGTPPLLQTSSDAGATWTDRDLSRYDVRQVLGVSVSNASYGEAAVRIGDDCRLAGMRSFTGGQFWEEEPEVLENTVLLDPGDRATVLLSGEAVAAPCADAVQAAEMAESPVTLCGDGSLFGWVDGAWAPQSPQPGALALVAGDAAPELVLAGSAECSLGVGFRTDPAAFVPRLCGATPAVPGATVAAAASDRTWVWAGDFFGAL